MLRSGGINQGVDVRFQPVVQKRFAYASLLPYGVRNVDGVEKFVAHVL